MNFVEIFSFLYRQYFLYCRVCSVCSSEFVGRDSCVICELKRDIQNYQTRESEIRHPRRSVSSTTTNATGRPKTLTEERIERVERFEEKRETVHFTKVQINLKSSEVSSLKLKYNGFQSIVKYSM
jgi:hypothetical protein